MDFFYELAYKWGVEPVIVLSGLVGVIIILFCLIGWLVYALVSTKIKHDSIKSLPEGRDSSVISEALQEKYRAEREQNDFKRKLEL